ncbi:MAG: CMP deaminase [Candidatus Marinimicrobia bacterium]|jgi:dCMP deaminase|nr:CMP deaminase [Candidatus Neomarinimicrobiota bacterium]
MKWDKRYIKLAKEVSTWSKDPSKQIGAVVIGSKGQVLAQGYNGFPRGVNDNPENYDNREVKYKMVVHAEMNCIFNASFTGTSLDGATLYVYGLPVCSSCAKGVIQVGIKNVVMLYKDTPTNWDEEWSWSKRMFDEAGVNYKTVDF